MSNVVVHDEDEVEMSADVVDRPYACSQWALVPSIPGLRFCSVDPNGIATNGYEVYIVNETAIPVTLVHDDADSAIGNRLFFRDNADHELGAYADTWGVRKETVAGRVGWWIQVPA